MPSSLVPALSHAELHNARPEHRCQSLGQVTYHRLSLSDSVSSSISKITDPACEVIDGEIAPKKSGATGGGRILVHCSAGISRSPMVVTAYLMKHKG